MSKLYIHENARLFDIPIQSLQESLGNCLPWLDSIFGRCEIIGRESPEGSSEQYPIWPCSDGHNSILIAPDDMTLGGTAFFVLDDPINIARESGKYQSDVSLILWGDMRRVTEERNMEYVKSEVLRALKNARLIGGSMRINEVSERPENVFRGFSFEETKNQFAVHPYFCLMVGLELTINEVCR